MRLRLAPLFAALLFLPGLAGCELIAKVDRAQIVEDDAAASDDASEVPDAADDADAADVVATDADAAAEGASDADAAEAAVDADADATEDADVTDATDADAPACVKDEDCPAPTGPCASAACVEGVCGTAPTAVETRLPTGQTVGDCQQLVCDGAGGVKTIVDDTDTPPTAPICLRGTCSNGTSAFVALAAMVPCTGAGGGVQCDGAGHCVTCVVGLECPSGVCQSGACVAATCGDGVQNGDETAKDCGGSCGPCGVGEACLAPTDCVDHVCDAKVCAAARCDDKVENGDETAVDCGGSCPACQDGLACHVAKDCQSGVCTGFHCAQPACDDNVQNGDETDKDCGGSCGPCGVGKACAKDGDCASGSCAALVCAAPVTDAGSDAQPDATGDAPDAPPDATDGAADATDAGDATDEGDAGDAGSAADADAADACSGTITFGAPALNYNVVEPDTNAPFIKDGTGRVLPSVGATVSLSAALIPSNLCIGPITWGWSIVSAPTGSAAALVGDDQPNPTLTPDVQGTYRVSLLVTDRLGGTWGPRTLDITTTSCGANAVTVSLGDSWAGKDFDPHALTATASSADDTLCPSRFVNTYSYAWTSVATPTTARSSLTAGSSSTATFAAGDPGSFVVTVEATGSASGRKGSAQKTFTTTCATALSAAAPTFTGATSPHIGESAGDVNRGDTVKLSSKVSTACWSSLASAGVTLSWSLAPASGDPAPQSFPALSNASALQPTFSVDRASRAYVASYVATDRWGRAFPSPATTVTSTSCGASAVTVAPLSDTWAGKDLDAHTLVATASSVDDDSTKCPASFANTYTYAWTATAAQTTGPSAPQVAPASHTGASFTVRAGDVGRFTATVSATGTSGKVGTKAKVFDVTCATSPVVTSAPSVSSGASVPHVGGDFNQGDVVSLGATVSAACYSNLADAQLSYAWTLSSALVDMASFPSLDGAATTTPSFTVDRPARTYIAGLVATDRWGHQSPISLTTFTSTSCGANPITVSIADGYAGSVSTDPHPLTATASSDDDDPMKCPATFAPTYGFTWAVTPSGTGTFTLSQTIGATTTFTVLTCDTFAVESTVTAPGHTDAKKSLQIVAQDASCTPPP